MNRIDELVRETLADRASQAPHPGPVLAHAFRKPTRRRVRLAGVVAAAAAVAAVAAGASTGIDAMMPDRGTNNPGSQQPAIHREAAIWAAVLEQTLRDNEDDLIGGVLPSRVHVVAQVYDDNAVVGEGIPVSTDAQREISAKLADLVTVEWLPEAESTTGPDAYAPPGFKDGTPLVHLSPLPEGEQQVTTRVRMLVGIRGDGGMVRDSHSFNDNYIVEKVDGEWKVTDRTE